MLRNLFLRHNKSTYTRHFNIRFSSGTSAAPRDQSNEKVKAGSHEVYQKWEHFNSLGMALFKGKGFDKARGCFVKAKIELQGIKNPPTDLDVVHGATLLNEANCIRELLKSDKEKKLVIKRQHMFDEKLKHLQENGSELVDSLPCTPESQQSPEKMKQNLIIAARSIVVDDDEYYKINMDSEMKKLLKEAWNLYDESAHYVSKRMGPNHIRVAMVKMELALMLQNMDRLSEATTAVEESIDISRKQAFGAGDLKNICNNKVEILALLNRKVGLMMDMKVELDTCKKCEGEFLNVIGDLESMVSETNGADVQPWLVAALHQYRKFAVTVQFNTVKVDEFIEKLTSSE